MEQLAVGDAVATPGGQVRTIRWIGRRAFAGRFIAGNEAVLPVMVQAGAIDDGLPERDLVLAPLHGLALDGLLIPVAALVNRSSIRRLTTLDVVDYLHLELDAPDLVLAEGVPAESLAASSGRSMFHNDAASAAVALPERGAGAEEKALPLPPRATEGPALAAVRARIDARAGLLAAAADTLTDPMAASPLGPLLAHVALPPRQPRPRRKPGRRRRALLIVPHLPDRHAPGPVLSHAVALRRLGYDVALVPIDGCIDATGEALDTVLSEAGLECLGAPAHRTVEEVFQRQDDVDLVYLAGAEVARLYEPMARRHAAALVVFAAGPLRHRALHSQAEVQHRPELLDTAQALWRQDLLAAYGCDITLVHSKAEAELLRQTLPGITVHVVPWDVPAGEAPCGAAPGVGLFGRFAEEAELDAARWLARAVMPQVWRQDPGIGLVLGTAEAPDAAASLAGPGVSVLPGAGVAELRGRVRVMAAPLRFGTGVHGPVVESMAGCMPCVMSPATAEGLCLAGPLLRLVAEGATAFAAVILSLHHEPGLHAACAAAGLDLARRDWSADAVDRALRLALGTGASRRKSLR